MRNLFLVFCLLVTEVVFSQNDSFSLENVGKIGLKLVSITTIDSVMPTCEFVDHPAGSFGKGITNANKVPGRMVITLLGDTLYDSGPYVSSVSGMTIKINGNTSAYKDPKPFKLKLQKKADLLFRDDELFADKDWRLLREDRTLNTVVGVKLNEMMGLQWTPQYDFCNVFINGEYIGLYLLIENVKRNVTGRLGVDKTGYIIERNAYWWNEPLQFKTKFFYDNRYGWTFKYPEDDKVTASQISYIKQYIEEFEASVNDGTYPDYIDVNSFATWELAHDILGTWDSGGSNLYVTKYDDTPDSKLVMGCLWDFDSSRSVGYQSYSRYHYGLDFYFEKLLYYNPNAMYMNMYKAKWAEIRKTLESEMSEFLTEFSASSVATAINSSRRLVGTKYGYKYTSVSSNVTTQRSWFTSHIPWLDKHIGLGMIVTPVSDVYFHQHNDGKTYNLQGIEVPADTRGLVIRNHRLIKQ